jgi:hypothetical protein
MLGVQRKGQVFMSHLTVVFTTLEYTFLYLYTCIYMLIYLYSAFHNGLGNLSPEIMKMFAYDICKHLIWVMSFI